MNFQVHTVETAPAEAAETLAGIEQRYGFIPNLAAVVAESPGAFKGLLAALQAYDDAALTLTPLQRQVVQIAVSVENRCEYCTAAHSMLACTMGLAKEEISSLHDELPLSDPQLESLRQFAVEIVRQRGWVEQESLHRFLANGFDKGQVLEVLQGIALKTFTNYANHITKPPLNVEFSDFLPNWQKAA